MEKKKTVFQSGHFLHKDEHNEDEDKGRMRIRETTFEVDRHGEVVVPEGGRFENFKANPLLLLSHQTHPAFFTDETQLPIGRVDPDSIEVVAGKHVDVTGEFDIGKNEQGVPNDPLATNVFFKFVNKFMHAFSIGFFTIVRSEEQVLEGQKHDTILEWEQAELSAVILPANAGAIALRQADLVMMKSIYGEKETDKAMQEYYGVKQPINTSGFLQTIEGNGTGTALPEFVTTISTDDTNAKTVEMIGKAMKKLDSIISLIQLSKTVGTQDPKLLDYTKNLKEIQEKLNKEKKTEADMDNLIQLMK